MPSLAFSFLPALLPSFLLLQLLWQCLPACLLLHFPFLLFASLLSLPTTDITVIDLVEAPGISLEDGEEDSLKQKIHTQTVGGHSAPATARLCLPPFPPHPPSLFPSLEIETCVTWLCACHVCALPLPPSQIHHDICACLSSVFSKKMAHAFFNMAK